MKFLLRRESSDRDGRVDAEPDGYELCRFVRNSQHLAHLPIISAQRLDPKTRPTNPDRSTLSRQARLAEISLAALAKLATEQRRYGFFCARFLC
jgi:hypothetical protein